jgi:DNA-binding NarL/FixJ family response regulator
VTAETARPTVSVVIVNDDAPFRTALGGVLALDGIEVVGQVASDGNALRVVTELAPDVVLMPGLGAVETTTRLAELTPSTAVLILATSADEGEVIDAMLAGACGYVLKGTPARSLAANIRAAAAGGCVMSAAIAATLFGSALETRARESLSKILSTRELEILALIADGKNNTDIAQQLVISPYTVRNHVSNVLHKLELENRTQAATYAARHGIG